MPIDDTKPDVWTLHHLGEMVWEWHQECRLCRRDVALAVADLRRRVDALEQGFRLVPLEPSGDRDNGGGGA